MRSGRIQASYIADDGRRYYCPHTFDARMDALGWLNAERRLIQQAEWTPPELRAKTATFMTLGEYIDQEWLPQRSLSPKTRATYRELFRLRIIPHLGDEYLPAITPQMVRNWWVGLDKDTPYRNYSAYTVLKSVFNTAIEDTYIKENPCQLKVRPPKLRDIEFLTPAELTVVAKSVPEHYRAAVYVKAFCALRSGELYELRRKT